MRRGVALVGLSLTCAALVGAVAPGLIVAAVGFVFPDASDMLDGVLFFPLICLFYIIGPIAAGVTANRIAGAVMRRAATAAAVDEVRIRMEARAAGILATILSWILIVQGSIYSVSDRIF